MKVIIPWDLFFWYASPVDFDNLWKKFDHKKNLAEWFSYHIEPSFKKFLLYREHVHFVRENGELKPRYFTFLVGSYFRETDAEYWIKFDKEHLLKDPQYMYSFCGLI